MLIHLSIQNLAVVKSLDMDFSKGLTTITGETGAGKSIAIDALSLCLGDRAEAAMVRKGAAKAEVSASFDISHLPAATQWLHQQEMNDEHECRIRRVISAEGRSKAFINGTPVGLQQLKDLGQYLISIHGQNAHQQLLKPQIQRSMLDGFASHPNLLETVSEKYKVLKTSEAQLSALRDSHQQRADRKQLLEYQVKELDDFALAQGEFIELETEHKRLSHSQTLLEQAQLSFHQLYEAEDFNALSAVQTSLERITELQEHDHTLAPIITLLNEAVINIDEAAKELRDYTEQLEIDPLRMQQVEARYSQAMELARKHQLSPENLYDYHQKLSAEYADLSGDSVKLEALEEVVAEATLAYQQAAEALSLSRTKSATKLAREVEQHIHKMNMSDARFTIDVSFDPQQSPQRTGLDNVEFKIAANRGQTPDKIEKVVSGGELSRLGLALQVISSRSNQIPTMIFDEVDTGISGPTASIVGQLLRKLGHTAQVMCVTHLPQVAACGHQQFFVSKISNKQSTETHMHSLSDEQRVEELARLLAGDVLTELALANAQELLSSQMH